MIGTTVLHQTHFLLPQESPDVNLRLKEQECLTLLRRCMHMEEFRQAHAQILKWGFFSNSFCASNLLATCALPDWGSMDYASSIFQQIEEPGTFEFNTMIKGYAKDFNMEKSLFVYCEMLEKGVHSDNFTFPSLLKACAWLKAIKEGMQIHGHIFKIGLESDLYVQNSLINMYGKCGKIQLSSAVFEQVDLKDVASWSAIIAVHTSFGMWCESLKLFKEMGHDRSCRPEESLYVSMLSACSHLGALDFGRCLHGILLRNISELNLTVQTSLTDMYINCGCIEKGLCLFQRMIKKNKFSYSVMISGLAMHGCSKEALEFFSEMLEEGLEPDDVIYVGVLSACSRAGLVEEGLQCFNRMKFEHGIEPTIQHYCCIVDLMGRAGMLNEALEFIRTMPIDPNDIVWRSLLSACKAHHNLKIGEIATKSSVPLILHNPSDLLILSHMYARAKKWEDSAMVRTELACQHLHQTPGFSLVEVKRKIYRFVSQDMSHRESEDIYEMIHQMEWQLKFEGYSPDTSQILLDVDEEEKRQRLKAHSQKLAIAFALIHASQGIPIRITRNLRMCNDCHTYTKSISKIYTREIIVRDRNYFHHFKDGACSCRDYW
ncbi:hypothetical protein P3X46_025914 [Hevea brasiliensis]|uniref:DYW domain-containing protein n=1 Tax=Hevea brasiliensis TaxID=3981 RepID=A0ABQ9KUZ4_HEVBR|nr:pentatricopeptide repeat-containing protein At1g31920 [Hevea brasiliensis]KAJ9152340.1 hypothetical protein P3X46_025914 [Hevea brasiliensis]